MSSENLNRLRAKELVSLLPGVHLRALQRLLDASFNTTRYHVYNLERDGEIICTKEGGHSRLYPAGLEEGSRSLYSALNSRSSRRVLTALLKSDGMATNDISALSGLPKSTASEHLETLCQLGLVRRTPLLGGGSSYEVQDRVRVGEALALFERNLLALAADSFIDLWGF